MALDSRPLDRHRTPENVLVYGPAGVGKTTTVRYVFDALAEETRVEPVHINCWQYNTRSSLLTELLIQLGYPAPRKGKPVDELLSKLREWLDKNRCVALALDEFDQLDDQNEIVYDLQHLSAETEHELGLVLVSNRPPDRLSLDARSMSRLSYRTIEFKSYGRKELIGILQQRVERAFHPGTVDESALEKIAEHVTDCGGDCRQAVNLLRRVGRVAEQQDLTTITGEVITKIVDVRRSSTRSIVMNYNRANSGAVRSVPLTLHPRRSITSLPEETFKSMQETALLQGFTSLTLVEPTLELVRRLDHEFVTILLRPDLLR